MNQRAAVGLVLAAWFAAMLAATLPAQVVAENGPSPEIAADLAGPWQIVPTGGTPACTVTLSLAPAPGGGWRAEPDALCAVAAPASIGTTGWTFVDGMRLLDAKGATLMRFEEDETALPSSPSVAAPAHYLVPAIPGFTRLRQPGEWAGAWQISAAAKGAPPCVLQFGPPAPLGPQRSGGTVSTRRCRNPAFRRIDRWYGEGLRLMLTGPDDAQIAFAPAGAAIHQSDDGRWRLARRARR